jgi:hypothetical protein
MNRCVHWQYVWEDVSRASRTQPRHKCLQWYREHSDGPEPLALYDEPKGVQFPVGIEDHE